MKYSSAKEQDTRRLGEKRGQKSRGGELFLLLGELGGGKTQFVKGLAKGLGIKDEITSPTFTYEKIYQGSKLTLYHFDLYRENEIDPDIRLLLSEAISDPEGVVAVEWADRARNFWPKKYELYQFVWKGENEREISVTKK